MDAVMSAIMHGSLDDAPVMDEEPRLVASLELVALPTAVSVARIFVANTLHRWKARSIEDQMQQVMAELVKIAVETTGPAEQTSWTGIAELNSIKLRMLRFDEHIVIEVVDCWPAPLVLADDDRMPEGQGLALVDAVANRWGSSTRPRGRVMWAELAAHETNAAGLPRRCRPARPEPSASIEWPPPQHDVDFLRRVRDGLKRP